MTKKVEDILQKLDFRLNKKISDDDLGGQYILVGLIKGRDVLLKIVSKKNKFKVAQFRKEKLVDDILEKHNRNLKKPLFVKVDLLGIGESKSYFWVIRKYYSGQSLAAYEPGKSLFGYDIIRRNFLMFRRKIVKQIIDNIEAINSLETDFRKLGINRADFPLRYKMNIEDYDIAKVGKELNLNLENLVKFYNRVQKRYFEKENIKASVGDLTPANIIIKKDGELIFSDFEMFCFDNYTIDIAYLFLFLWRYKNWQKELINLTITNDESRDYFCASIIRILMFLYKWPYYSLDEKNKKNLDSESIIRKHIWRRYLQAAGESFDAILKVK